jgi:hypothetical protein
VGVPGTRLRSALTLATIVAMVAVVGWPSAAAPGRAVGVITGVVTTKAPSRPPLRVTIDPEVCGSAVPDESVAVDAAGHLANAVITVGGVNAPAPAEILLTNEKCRFSPRVALLRPRGAVKMTSHDPVLHTMHAAATDGRAFFNVSLPVPKLTLSRPIDRAGLVRLTCSTHTFMRGFLHVTDELSAVSGADGEFRLEGVPTGPQVLRLWHETLTGAPVKVVVKDGAPTRVTIEFKSP